MSETEHRTEKRVEVNNSSVSFADLPWTRWPEILPKTAEDEILPLKVGISNELEELLPSDQSARGLLRRALRRYTRSFRYLDAVADDGAMRYGIDKSTVGLVSELDRHSASLELHRRAIVDRERTRKAERSQRQTAS